MHDASWSLAIHAALLVACWRYAAFLQRIYRLYHPDYTWMTVVGGTVLVGLAFGLECLLLGIDLRAPLLFGTLFVTAGLPIIRWQRDEADARARKREALKREDESHAAQAGGKTNA